jgi:hypothetical protein
MLTLLEKQKQFSVFLARFIVDLGLRGYGVTLGEAYRPLGVAMIYAAQNEGIKNSLHTLRLAIDLNIFLGTHWMQSKDELIIPGVLWESYSNDLICCVWGGRFTHEDCDHFSISHSGIK